MEFSERCIQLFEKEGFLTISEQSGLPNKTQAFPALPVPAAFMVTDGECMVVLATVTRQLRIGDRIDIPAASSYVITAGPTGCHMIFAEK